MSPEEKRERERGLTRKELIGSGASAAAAALLAQGIGVESALGAKGGRRNVAGMNIVLFLTDQERAIQHFPRNWLRQNMPGMRRLRRHGLSFERAFTNACMCSPARSTLMSGYFPAQHGVKYTLEEDMEPPKNPQVDLPTDIPNLATVMKAAGYNVIYKGKWHCSKPAEPEHAVPADLEKYGFDRWNPPDAGANQTVPEAGGGYPDNDGRFIDSTGDRRRRRRAAVPQHQRRPGTALLPRRLAGQPARRPLLPEQDLRRSRLRRHLAARQHPRARDLGRRPLDQALGADASSGASSTSPASPKTANSGATTSTSTAT